MRVAVPSLFSAGGHKASRTTHILLYMLNKDELCSHRSPRSVASPASTSAVPGCLAGGSQRTLKLCVKALNLKRVDVYYLQFNLLSTDFREDWSWVERLPPSISHLTQECVEFCCQFSCLLFHSQITTNLIVN